MAQKYTLKTKDFSTGALPSLDSLKNNRNNFCGSLSVRRQVSDGGPYHYARVSCKRWACSLCGPRRVRQLRFAIIKWATEKDMTRFLTLTLDPRFCTAKESVKYIRGCWNKFRTYLKRKYGVSISFITIIEPQKSGYAHLHILVDRFIPQHWITGAWQAVGGGKIVFVRQVEVNRIAAYLSKYLTKATLLTIVNAKYRRCTTSRDIVLFAKRKPDGKWEVIFRSMDLLHLKAKARGCLLELGLSVEGLVQWIVVSNSLEEKPK